MFIFYINFFLFPLSLIILLWFLFVSFYIYLFFFLELEWVGELFKEYFMEGWGFGGFIVTINYLV